MTDLADTPLRKLPSSDAEPPHPRRVGSKMSAGIIAVLTLTSFAMGLWWHHLDQQGRAAIPVTSTSPYADSLADRWSPSSTTLTLDQVRPPEPVRVRRGQTPVGLLQELGLDRRSIGAVRAWMIS